MHTIDVYLTSLVYNIMRTVAISKYNKASPNGPDLVIDYQTKPYLKFFKEDFKDFPTHPWGNGGWMSNWKSIPFSSDHLRENLLEVINDDAAWFPDCRKVLFVLKSMAIKQDLTVAERKERIAKVQLAFKVRMRTCMHMDGQNVHKQCHGWRSLQSGRPCTCVLTRDADHFRPHCRSSASVYPAAASSLPTWARRRLFLWPALRPRAWR